LPVRWRRTSRGRRDSCEVAFGCRCRDPGAQAHSAIPRARQPARRRKRARGEAPGEVVGASRRSNRACGRAKPHRGGRGGDVVTCRAAGACALLSFACATSYISRAPPSPDSAVTVSPSEFLPGVSFPLPAGTGSKHVGVDSFDVLPFLAIRWQVLDFGRSAGVEAAEHASDAANVSFTAAHQKVVFEVTQAY